MRCPICLEDLQQTVMAPCYHVYCRPCIDAWTKDSVGLPANSTCPVCRGTIQPLREAPWLDSDSNPNPTLNSDLEQIPPALVQDLRNKRLSNLVDKIKQHPKKTVPKSEAEPHYVCEVGRLVEQKQRKEQQLKDKFEKKLAKLEAVHQDQLQIQYQQYQSTLTNEEITAKKIESENEYIDFLADIGTSLSTQQPEVLDQHYQSYVDKCSQLVPTFMGVCVGDGSWFYMPETPVCYVEQVNKLLVTDGKSLWYYGHPEVSIPHTGVFVKSNSFLNLVQPNCVHRYNFDLSRAEEIVNRQSDRYFITISNYGIILEKSFDAPISWFGFKVLDDYDHIYRHNDTLVTTKGNTTTLRYKDGRMEVYDSEHTTVTRMVNGVQVDITKEKVTDSGHGRKSVIHWSNGIPTFLVGNNTIFGPKLGTTYTKLVFGQANTSSNEDSSSSHPSIRPTECDMRPTGCIMLSTDYGMRPMNIISITGCMK